MAFKHLFVSAIAFVIWASPIARADAPASADPFEAKVKADIAAGRYETAATELDTADKLAVPKYLFMYTKLLVDDYAMNINFQIFAVKDLAPGETIASIRGKQGQYKLMGGQLEEILYRAFQQKPSDPYVNYAVGYYLSRAEGCGCAGLTLFKGAEAEDGPYFIAAEKGAILDGWALFRIGVHYHSQQPPELDKAIVYYRRAINYDPGNIDAVYNLASALFADHKVDEAIKQIRSALNAYKDPKLNADAHVMYAQMLLGKGDQKEAETQCRAALDLQYWNSDAFSCLIQILRKQGRDDEYVQEVLHFIALDYSNTFTFNAYIDTLQQIGLGPADSKVEAALLALKIPDNQAGPLYFNLGKMAQMENRPKDALQRFQTSLAAMKRLPQPPPGAIDALNQLIAQLQQG